MSGEQKDRAPITDIGVWRHGSFADPDKCTQCNQPLHPGRDCKPRSGGGR